MNGEISGWVAKEFETLDFQSKRLEIRFKKAMSDISEQPDKSILLASGSRARAKAAYRMLGNEKFDKESILSAHRDAIEERSGEEMVLLAVQDTTSINYATHAKTKDMGYNCEQTRGVNVHSCILITREGIPTGVVAQSIITRVEKETRGVSHQEKRMRPIEEKESYRWLETMVKAGERAPKNVRVVHIADREGDIYELYALAQETGQEFVIRGICDRVDPENKHVMKELRERETAGKTEVTIPANRKKKTEEREAILRVQYLRTEIKKPQIRAKDPELAPSLTVTLIRMSEETPPGGEEGIEWILITNIEVKNAEDALVLADYYRQRWKIERFHYVLKSGCEIEELQQRSVHRLELMILMYSIITIHIMQLTYLARNAPETPCDLILSEKEWKTLYRAGNRTTIDAETPPSMQEAVRLIAKLGGRVGAKSDGPPGLKVIWMGLYSLYMLVTYRDVF